MIRTLKICRQWGYPHTNPSQNAHILTVNKRAQQGGIVRVEVTVQNTTAFLFTSKLWAENTVFKMRPVKQQLQPLVITNMYF